MKDSRNTRAKRREKRFAWVFASLVAVVLLHGCAGSITDAALPETLLNTARASEGALDYRGAADAYRKLSSLAPNNVEMTLGLARNLRYAGEAQDSAAVVGDALTRLPKEAALLLEMGKIQIALVRCIHAVDILTQARAVDAGNWQIHTALGVARDCLEQYKEARESYQVALGLSQDNPVVLNNMALSMAQAGEVDDAATMLEQAAKHPNATAQIRQNLALLKAIKGETVEAERLENQNLPPDVARHNMEYLRILAAKARQKQPQKQP